MYIGKIRLAQSYVVSQAMSLTLLDWTNTGTSFILHTVTLWLSSTLNECYTYTCKILILSLVLLLLCLQILIIVNPIHVKMVGLVIMESTTMFASVSQDMRARIVNEVSSIFFHSTNIIFVAYKNHVRIIEHITSM